MSIDIPALKSAISLPELIGDYVRLTKRGSTLWACCPFHKERTASFAVHPTYFHCHGCHVNGDAIQFTALIENVSNGRAMRMLTKRYAIPLGPRQTPAESAYMRGLRAQAEYWWAAKRSLVLAALEAACARYFADQSPRNEAVADAAGRYLRMMDGIAPAIRGRAFLLLRTAEDNRAWMTARRVAKIYMETHEGLMVTDWIRARLSGPDGLDPAEFVRRCGSGAYRAAIDSAFEVPMDMLAFQGRIFGVAA